MRNEAGDGHPSAMSVVATSMALLFSAAATAADGQPGFDSDGLRLQTAVQILPFVIVAIVVVIPMLRRRQREASAAHLPADMTPRPDAVMPRGSFDASALPRIYRVRMTTRVLGIVVGLLLIGGLATLIALPVLHPPARGAGPMLPLLLAMLPIGGVGLYLIAATWRYRVLLDRDHIEIRSLRTRRLDFDDIAGRRARRGRYGTIRILVPKPGRGRRVMVSRSLDTDTTWQRWLDSLRDLDREDRAASEAALLEDATLGGTPEVRRARLAQGNRIAKWLSGLALGVSVWGGVYPAPYQPLMLLLVLIPVVTLLVALQGGGLYRLGPASNDAHPNLFLALAAPAFALAVRGCSDVHLLEWHQALLLAALGGVALTLLTMLLESGAARATSALLLTALCMGAYSLGVGIEADTLLDHGAPSHYRSEVVDKQVTHGRHPQWRLALAPWGPRHDTESVSVAPAFYRSVPRGETLCIDLRSGEIGLPWYTLNHCTDAR